MNIVGCVYLFPKTPHPICALGSYPRSKSIVLGGLEDSNMLFKDKFNAGTQVLTAVDYLGESATGWHNARVSDGQREFDVTIPPDHYEGLQIDENDVVQNGRLVGQDGRVLQCTDVQNTIDLSAFGRNGKNSKAAK